MPNHDPTIPSSPLAEPALSLGPQAPSGHGQLGANGFRFLAGWEGLKALYRAAVEGYARADAAVADAWHLSDTWPLGAGDSDAAMRSQVACRIAAREALADVLSMARISGRLAWGDETEATLYLRLCAEATAASHQHHAA